MTSYHVTALTSNQSQYEAEAHDIHLENRYEALDLGIETRNEAEAVDVSVWEGAGLFKETVTYPLWPMRKCHIGVLVTT